MSAVSASQGSSGCGEAYDDGSSSSIQRVPLCAVCKVDTGSYNLNYGASTCLSCRAFFRRIVQQRSQDRLQCHAKKVDSSLLNQCEVNPETRKRCRRCRYEACLRAGMREEAVLDGDGFQQRFKRMIRKKTTNVKGQEREEEEEDGDRRTSMTEEEEAQEEIEEEVNLPLDLSQQPQLSFASRVRQTWDESCREVQRFSDFSRHLASLHGARGRHQSRFSKTALRTHLDDLGRLLSAFALRQPEFGYLQAADRELLLRNNTGRFVQHVLSKYFFAGSALKQRQWLLLFQFDDGDDVDEENDLSRFIPLQTLDEILRLFRRGLDGQPSPFLHRYVNLAGKMSRTSSFLRQNDVALLALSCLFDHDETTGLSNDGIAVARRVLEASLDGCENASSTSDILGEMVAEFEAGVDWTENENGGRLFPPISHVMNPFPETTEQCYAELGRKVDAAFEAFPFGGDLVRHFVMFSLDVPLPKYFLKKTIKVWEDRYRSIVSIFVPEESSSSSLVTRNVLRVIALTSVMHASAKTGGEIMRHALGIFDLELLGRYLPQIGVPRRLDPRDILASVGLSSGQMDTFFRCYQRVSVFLGPTRPGEAFALLSIDVLFRDLDNPRMPEAFSPRTRAEFVGEMLRQFCCPSSSSTMIDLYKEFCSCSDLLSEWADVIYGLCQKQ